MEHADGHRYFEGLAVAHVLGGLDDSEGRVFRAHLLECSTCRARVGELRAIAHDLADVERDERRVRAAQAIDTKRREDEDELVEPAEQLPSQRSSRITVIVGLVLIMGLSLWNFTLRSALTLQEGTNRQLVGAGVVADLGEEWTVVGKAPRIEGSVKAREGRFLLTLDNLDPEQIYGIYVQRADDTVAANYTVPRPDGGRVYQPLNLPADAESIVVIDPSEDEGTEPKAPGPTPNGVTVFEAMQPPG
jgi:hypothetical protein